MPNFVSIDWTGSAGRPDGGQPEHFGPAVVSHPPEDELAAAFSAWRSEFGLMTSTEFKGYKLHKNVCLMVAIARYVLENARVSVALIDGRELLREFGQAAFDAPDLLKSAITLSAAERAFQTEVEYRVYYDGGDFCGKLRKPFETRMRRLARGMNAAIATIKGVDSRKSCGVQLADVVAWLVRRHVSEDIASPEISRAVGRICRASDNTVRLCRGSDLRLYL
jgi:hypothetical protein